MHSNRVPQNYSLTQLQLSRAWYLIVALFVVTIAILRAMGRIWYCSCGYIKFWQSDTWSSENSQHIADWYTFSHLIHGFIFYWLLQKFFPKWSIGSRMVAATFVEVCWELIENSPVIINRYRATTISLNYFGDSIINTAFDIFASILGFWLARKLPVWVSVVLIVAMEVGVGYMIKDNLLLNIIMLIYPSETIKAWQMQ